MIYRTHTEECKFAAHEGLGLPCLKHTRRTTQIENLYAYLGALGIEVACSGSEDQIAVGVSLPRLDQREVTSDRLLHDVVTTVEVAGLAGLAGNRHRFVGVVFDGETTFLDHRAVGGGGEEGGDAST